MADELIDRLAQDLRPVRGGVVGRRLALGLGVGAAGAFVVMAAWLGMRPDLAVAVATRMFWMKLAYTGAIGVIGAFALERLARPTGPALRRIALVAIPVLVIGLVAAVRLYAAAPADVRPLVMGGSARVCARNIAVISVPLLIAAVWAVRGLAPVRLRSAGALAGLTAGGLAAMIYCLHCPEVAPPFVAVWYSLGILIPCAIGALLGPRLLRW